MVGRVPKTRLENGTENRPITKGRAMAKIKRFRRRGKDQSTALPWEEIGPTDLGKRAVDALRAGKRLGSGPGKILRRKESGYQFDIGDAPRSSKWWDLYRDGINQSGLSLWLSCKHQFWLQYVCGYQYEVYNVSLEFGNVFHWLIERWLKGELSKDPAADLRTVYHPSFIKGWKNLPSTAKAEQEINYAVAVAIWPHYARHYAADLKRKWTSLEGQFSATVKSKGCQPITIYGTQDGAFRDGKRTRLTDTKTTSRITEYEIENTMGLNFQLLTYSLAHFINTGKCPSSVEHNVIRRTTSKPHKGESLSGFIRRIGKEVAKKPAYFFYRFRHGLTQVDLERFRDFVFLPILRDLERWAYAGGPHYPNLNALLTKYGPCRLFVPITSNNFAGVPRQRPTTNGVPVE